MSMRPSDAFGERLAYYRKLAGVSAQTLSNRIGGTLSRGVIANIESGRKKDVTVDDVVALAWALDIPFAALALPLDRPQQFLHAGDARVRIYEIADWLQTGNRRRPTGNETNPAQTLAQARMRGILNYSNHRRQIARSSRMLEAGNTDSDWQAILKDEQRALDETLKTLSGLGVDMTAERIGDDPEGEEVPSTTEVRVSHYDVFRDKGRLWRFNLVADDGKVIASSEPFESKDAAMSGIEAARKSSAATNVSN